MSLHSKQLPCVFFIVGLAARLRSGRPFLSRQRPDPMEGRAGRQYRVQTPAGRCLEGECSG